MSVKISELPVLDSLADNDVLAGVDTSANVTSKVTLSSLKEYIDTNTTYTGGTNIDITNNVVSAPNVYNKTETDNLLSAKESLANKITSISSSSTNAQYPSAKSVYNHVSTTKTQIEETLGDVINETKGELDGDIEQLNNEVEELQSEVDSLSTIFNAFPTESGEGESLTLDDTAEVKFKKIDLKGNTSQIQYSNANFMKSSLQQVKTNNPGGTWTGNKYVTNGITYTYNEDGSVTANGTASSNASFYISRTGTDYIHGTLKSGTYYLTSHETTGSNNTWKLQINLAGTNYNIHGNSTSAEQTVTLNDDSDIIATIIVYAEKTVNNVTFYPMIATTSGINYVPPTEGEGSPSPNYPQPINVVSGDNDIVVTSKNRLGYPNFSSVIAGNVTFTNNKGVYTISGTSSATYTDNFDVPNYTIQEGDYIQYNNDFADTHIGFTLILSDGSNYFNSFTSQNRIVSLSNKVGLTIKKVRFNFNSGYTFNGTCSPMIVNSSTSIPFEEYVGNTYNIDLPVENLFTNTNKESTTGTIYNNGFTLTKSGNRTVRFRLPQTLQAGTYTLSFELINTNYTGSSNFFFVNIQNGSENTEVLGNLAINKNTSVTFTVPSEFNKFYFFLGSSSSTPDTTTITIDNVQLEKDSKANSFTPYGTTPIEMCKIGNYQDGFGKSDGRNLYKVDDITTTTKNGVTYSVENEVITLNGTVSSGFDIDLSSYYPLEAGTYTISCQVISGSYTGTIGKYVRKPNGSGYTNIIDGSSLTVTRTVTVSESNENSYSALYLIGGTVCNNLKVSIQLEKGSSSTEWQPYGVGKWYLHKEIGKVVLNGSESWSKSGTTSIDRFFFNIDLPGKTETISKNTLKCSHFNIINTSASEVGTMFVGASNNLSAIFVNYTSYGATTLAQWKTWLENNQPILYHVLGTPTNTEITYQPLIDQLNLLEKAMSKEGETNISQVNNDKPFIINAEAILSLKNVLDRVTLLES